MAQELDQPLFLPRELAVTAASIGLFALGMIGLADAFSGTTPDTLTYPRVAAPPVQIDATMPTQNENWLEFTIEATPQAVPTPHATRP